MQRILTVQNFKQVLPGQAVLFETSEEFQRETGRLIRLRVNAPEGTMLKVASHPEHVDPETGELISYFLAYVDAGYDEIEFTMIGDFTLHTLSEVWLDTFEGSKFVVEPADFENYFRLMERPEEDPRVAEFRRLQRQLQREREYQRYLDRLEMEERLAAMEEKYKANVDTTATASAAASQSPASGVAPVGVAGADAAGPAAPAGTGGEPDGAK